MSQDLLPTPGAAFGATNLGAKSLGAASCASRNWGGMSGSPHDLPFATCRRAGHLAGERDNHQRTENAQNDLPHFGSPSDDFFSASSLRHAFLTTCKGFQTCAHDLHQ